MNDEEKRWYARGYNAGVKGRWPDHRPPNPPDEILSRVIGAARDLRDSVDSEIATMDEDDELSLTLGPKIDAFDQSMADIGKWLRLKGES